MDISNGTPKTDVSSTYCPHCKSCLSRKAFDTHKRLYYDAASNQWIKKRCLTTEEHQKELNLTEQAIEECDYDFSVLDDSQDNSIDQHDVDSPPPIVDFGDIPFDQPVEDCPAELNSSLDAPESEGLNTYQPQTESDDIEIWEDYEEDLELFNSTADCSSSSTAHSLTLWLVLFLLHLQSKHYVPDKAIDRLLKFLHAMFKVIGRFSDLGKEISECFPTTTYSLQRFVGINREGKKFVVCQECDSVYNLQDCIDRPTISKLCTYKEFSHSRKCQALLLKTVELASSKRVLYPFKVYCYQSLKDSLALLYKQKDFHTLCEHWRTRDSSVDTLGDVYDGQIWKDFQNVSCKPFLSSPFGIGLSLNVDWFQPFDLTQYSVGVIYLTVLNLPRHARNKQQYSILVGVIPGPTEPKRDINSFLCPLVKELLSLWEGEYLSVHGFPEKQLIRAALLCVACDIPAARKVAGFLGHSATHGCSKCMREFPGAAGSMNYSGFDRTSWTPRTNRTHRASVSSIQKCSNKTQRQRAESKYGCRYSVLLDLHYFDPVRMVVIDPMHNLFLGSAKHIMRDIWLNNGILTKSKLLKMQKRVDGFHVPPDCGRIPRKLESNFSGFTANQYKNWVVVYSIPVLYDLVESVHLECWRHFVLACRLLCKYSLSIRDTQVADALLLRFCKKVEQLFGTSSITPNMHLHGHLKEDIREFGPVHTFWLYAYERLNGVLGSYPNNNKTVESQLMKKFSQDNLLLSISLPHAFKDDFSCSLFNDRLNASNEEDIVLPPRSVRSVLSPLELESIQNIVSKMKNVPLNNVQIGLCFRKYKTIRIRGDEYSSLLNKSSHHHIMLVKWDVSIFGSPPTRLPNTPSPTLSKNTRPVQVHYYAHINYAITADGQTTLFEEDFAVVSWFFPHQHRYMLGQPAEIWCKSLFETTGPHSCIPLNLIACRCAYSFIEYEALDECVLVVVDI